MVGSTLAGYVVGGGSMADAGRVLAMVGGTALVAGGASAFNQVLERKSDALMRRTQTRPMAEGRMLPADALVFAAVLSVTGLLVLAFAVNPLSAAVAGATLLSYAAIYTPLKLRTSFATVIGAVPGALPPVIGWAAATNGLAAGAWILFGIVFLWQLPHFLAIAWMYRDDYARAGFSDAARSRAGRPEHGAAVGALCGGAAAAQPRADARRPDDLHVFRGGAAVDARLSGAHPAVRAHAQRGRRPARLLRVDRLPDAAGAHPILSGELPFEHGVRDNVGFTSSRAMPFAAAALHERGYATGGFVSAYVLRARSASTRGSTSTTPAAAASPATARSGQLQRAGEATLAAAAAGSMRSDVAESRSSSSFTSTSRTRRTRRRRASPPTSRTTARWPTRRDRRASCSSGCARWTSTTAPRSSCSPTTARGWAITASRSTASSSTTRPPTFRSS